jgi:hypothetical protein
VASTCEARRAASSGSDATRPRRTSSVAAARWPIAAISASNSDAAIGSGSNA